ncbi:MAG TPA: FG-GAP repeat protein, partial [Longimicrobiales bacterium]|nr:FG-GAP repeat protein [Longimicrobiales bacterium]
MLKLQIAGALLASLVAVPVTGQGGFGRAVAVGDGAVFVAEPNNIARPGIVYVYGPGSAGRWTEAARLTAPDAVVGDRFGAALAIHGGRLLVSRLTDNDNRGTTFLFERRGQAWQNTGRLNAADAAPNDSVGVAVALAGDLAVLGAPAANGKAGAVYVMRRSQDGRWSQEARLTASDAQPNDRFGSSVAVDG